jgi:hypothetical protein
VKWYVRIAWFGVVLGLVLALLAIREAHASEYEGEGDIPWECDCVGDECPEVCLGTDLCTEPEEVEYPCIGLLLPLSEGMLALECIDSDIGLCLADKKREVNTLLALNKGLQASLAAEQKYAAEMKEKYEICNDALKEAETEFYEEPPFLISVGVVAGVALTVLIAFATNSVQE